MKIVKEKTTNEKIIGYMLRLSAVDTYNWAHKINAEWPCSQLSNKRLWVAVDSNGLYDYQVSNKQPNLDNNELSACVADHLPNDCKHLWPCWS